MRSYLFVPGHNQRLLDSAKRSDADVLILDLEDSVPEGYKDMARDMIEEFTCDKPIYVRISLWDHIPYLGEKYGIMIPKADLTMIKFYRDFCDKLIPLIETTQGVLESKEICMLDNVVAIAFGGEDFKADLQGTDTYTARVTIAIAARAAGIEPIDTVYTDLDNTKGFEQYLTESKSLGYRSTLCFHPKQIPLIHKHFTPSVEEIAQAKEVIRLSEQAAKEGKGVAIIDGKFIGPPMVRMAHKILKS